MNGIAELLIAYCGKIDRLFFMIAPRHGCVIVRIEFMRGRSQFFKQRELTAEAVKASTVDLVECCLREMLEECVKENNEEKEKGT